MVQAIENWCCVTGTIDKLDSRPQQSKGKSDQAVLLIRVAKIMPVDGYPTLIHAEDAGTISLLIRRSQLDGEEVGGRQVSIPVRVAGPDRYFAHPDWSLARGSAMCGAN
jgi:hypothetical protein